MASGDGEEPGGDSGEGVLMELMVLGADWLGIWLVGRLGCAPHRCWRQAPPRRCSDHLCLLPQRVGRLLVFVLGLGKKWEK